MLSNKKNRKHSKKDQSGHRSRHSANVGFRTKGGIGLPTDPWWEEAFKLGVERVAAEAALNSLEDAKKRGIIGPKVYDKLREVYVEKLTVVGQKTTNWHQEFPSFSEPESRREMMNELSKAAAQPYEIPSTVVAMHRREEQSTSYPTGSPRTFLADPAPTKMEPKVPAGPINTRRAMLDELKGILSSATHSLTKAPASSISGKHATPQRKLARPPAGADKASPKSPPNVQAPKVPTSSPAPRLPTKIMELNREFLEEYRKLRKGGPRAE